MSDQDDKGWAIYLRVSTTGQENDGMGLEVQEQLCRRWLDERKLPLKAIYKDACSGSLMERDALADLLVSARKEKNIVGVVFARLDRLARDVLVQEYLLTQFDNYKLAVRCAVPEEDALLNDADSDPSRKMLRVILGAVAEFERKMITRRTSAAKRNMAARGMYVGGVVGNGYYIDPQTKQRRLHPELVPVARQALRMRKLGVSFASIAEFMIQSGYPSQSNTGEWTATGIRRKLEQFKKMGYEPAERLSVTAGHYTGGRL